MSTGKTLKVATAAYPLDVFQDWADYAAKIRNWVSEAAENGARLLVFPEYGSMELATLAGLEAAGDLEQSLHAVAERIPAADDLHADLAREFSVYILAASAPVFDSEFGDRPVNRARFFSPAGEMGVQDKQIMTRFEREDWNVVGGGPLRLFETEFGKIGILICYDSEFPLFGHALRDADIILVPSCTEAHAGYTRVRIGSQARALEQQCVTVMSSTVGDALWSEAVDHNCGQGGVFGPPDRGFPSSGVMAEGVLDQPGWTYCDIDTARIHDVRKDGGVLNWSHWEEQNDRAPKPQVIGLR